MTQNDQFEWLAYDVDHFMVSPILDTLLNGTAIPLLKAFVSLNPNNK